MVQVCFDYSGFNVNENKLQLRHFVAVGEALTVGGVCDGTSPDYSPAAQGCWENVTQESPIPTGVGFQNEGQANPDTADDIICGLTATLSPFILVETVGIDGPTGPVSVGTEVELSMELTGSGPVDLLVWDWGDGTVVESPVTGPPGVESVSHTYLEPNIYVARVSLLNDGIEVGSAALRYVVVFDPDGGFVTGGGWILSPAGAFAGNATLHGKAVFGFVSKYQRGANVPTGNTEFRFRAAALDFRSVEYEWLVVAGTMAQFKGKGTVNGSGDFGFLLTATDDSDGDTFRLKLWDREAGDSVLYDNGAQTPIEHGSIVIHSR